MTLKIPVFVDQLYASFKNTLFTSVANAVPEVISVATTFATDEEKSLKDLGISFLNKEIDIEFLKRRLAEVKEDLTAALISIEQIIASDIQTLVDSLINIFTNLLTAALSVIK